MLKIRHYLLLLLFSLVSIIPFNYLQFITLSIGRAKLPFYYPALGIPVFVLAILALAEKKAFRNSGLTYQFLILYASLLLSLLTTVSFPWSIRSIASFSLRGPLVTIAMFTIYHKTKDVKQTVNFMLIVGLFVASIGIFEFICGKNFLYHNLYIAHNPCYPQVLDLNWRGGICGTIGHPLPLAAFLVLLLPLTLTSAFFISNNQHNMYTVFRMSAFFALGLCIYLSFSRSSWISAGVCAALYFFGQHSSSVFANFRKSLIMIGVMAISLIAIHIFLPKAHSIFHSRTSWAVWRTEIFRSHRAASYKTVYNILKKYPLFGVGFGNYPKVHKKFVAEGASPEIETPDNQYLRWLADTGLVGFGCLVAFFVLFFRKFAKAYRKCPDEELKTLMWAMFCGIVGFMVNLMAFDGFFWMAPNFAFWMMIGLLAAAINLAEKKTDAIKEVAD